jgi:hypothetical protein
MTETEKRLLLALAWMCEQYMGSGKQTGIDHECMGAGEDAIELLVEHGLIAPSGRGARGLKPARPYLLKANRPL